MRAEPAALEVIKQLQRASLPRLELAPASRIGRPDAFAACASAAPHVACVTLSMMVFRVKASKRVSAARAMNNRLNHSVRWIIRLVGR